MKLDFNALQPAAAEAVTNKGGPSDLGDWIFWILDSAIVKWAVLVVIMVMPIASLLTWAERRQSAMMQDRLGPNRANIWRFRLWGILHFIADAVKMIGKEDFVPKGAHRPLFDIAPILSLAPVFIAFAIIPFGPTIYPGEFWNVIDLRVFDAAAQEHTIRQQVFQIEWGLLFYFAILTIANYGSVVAGWASYNKWALLGGLRASSQMMSYEVAMGLSLMAIFLLSGTLEPGTLVSDWQGPNPLTWGWAKPAPFLPLGLCAFILFFAAAIAETKRAPFDLPEGESEIIGYFVEYSGIRWGMFFLAEFIEIVFISAVIVTVFFGGYHFPFLHPDGFHIGHWVAYVPHYAVLLLSLFAFLFKVVFFCWLQLAIRWTVPRFRPDQLMMLGWKRLLPLALVNVMITSLAALLPWDKWVL